MGKIKDVKNGRYKTKLSMDASVLTRAGDAFGVQADWCANNSATQKSMGVLALAFQKKYGLVADGILGPRTYKMMSYLYNGRSEREIAVYKVIWEIMAFESAGKPDAANRNTEFRLMKKHPAYQKYHIGLSLGYIQMTQDGGTLGKWAKMCYDDNPEKFKEIVGSTYKELLAVITAPGRSGFSQRIARGPRVKPIPVEVNGKMVNVDLWEEPWVSKMKKLAVYPEFEANQIEIATEIYLESMLPLLKELDARSEKAVAIAFNLAVHYGPSRAREIIVGNWNRTAHEQDNLKRIAVDLSKKTLGVITKKSRPLRILENKRITTDVWAGFERG